MLKSLYAAGEFKGPEDPTPNRKRPRDNNQPEEESSTQRSSSASEKSSESQPSASKRASYSSVHQRNPSQDVPPASAPSADSPWGGSQVGWSGMSSDSSSPASFELPVRTVELERMPFGTGFSPFFDARFARPQQTETPGTSQSVSNGMAAPEFAQFASPVDFPFAVAQPPPPTTTAQPVNGTQSTSGLAAFFHPFGSIQVVEPPTSMSQDPAAFQFPPLQQQPQPPPSQSHISTLSTMGPPPDREPPSSAQALPSFSEDDLALADNTLDMWSSAPTNLE